MDGVGSENRDVELNGNSWSELSMEPSCSREAIRGV